MSEKLKDCPLCGAEAKTQVAGIRHHSGWVTCPAEQCIVSNCWHDPIHWNAQLAALPRPNDGSERKPQPLRQFRAGRGEIMKPCKDGDWVLLGDICWPQLGKMTMPGYVDICTRNVARATKARAEAEAQVTELRAALGEAERQAECKVSPRYREAKRCDDCGTVPDFYQRAVSGHGYWYPKCRSGKDCKPDIPGRTFVRDAIDDWNREHYKKSEQPEPDPVDGDEKGDRCLATDCIGNDELTCGTCPLGDDEQPDQPAAPSGETCKDCRVSSPVPGSEYCADCEPAADQGALGRAKEIFNGAWSNRVDLPVILGHMLDHLEAQDRRLGEGEERQRINVLCRHRIAARISRLETAIGECHDAKDVDTLRQRIEVLEEMGDGS